MDLTDIAGRWPGAAAKLARAAAYSTLLGATNARPVAASLFHDAINSGDAGAQEKLDLCSTFGMIDEAAAAEVLALMPPTLVEIYQLEETDYWKADRLLDVVKQIARRYASEEAMTVLLDAALEDTRSTNHHTCHPVRALQDLVHDFHPELSPPEAHRSALASALDSWFSPEQATEAHWNVFGDQTKNLLAFSLGSAYASPEKPHSVQLIHTVVRPNEMSRIYDTIWPGIRSHLEHAPVEVLACVVDAAVDWLRLGAGFDRPFGGSHSPESIAMAAELGGKLVGDLAPLIQCHLGLERKLESAAEVLGVEIHIEGSGGNTAFFTDVERVTDWKESVDRLESGISAVVREWSLDSPSTVLVALAEIKRELDVAGIAWPDRIRMAFAVIAQVIDSRSIWIAACLDASLFPQAGPLLEAAVEAGEPLPEYLWQRCWADPGARWEALSLVLRDTSSSTPYDAALNEMRASDFRLVESMFIRGELTTDNLKDLLTHTQLATRAAVAAAMFAGSRRDASWTPGELEDEWTAAITALNFVETAGLSAWHVKELFEWMAAARPGPLVELVIGRLSSDDSVVSYDALPHDAWHALHRLPSEHKTTLWTSLSDRSGLWILRQYLVGEDSAWLEEMLDAGLFNEEEALSAYSGLGPHPRIEDLAKILVPRGVVPEEIAGLAQSGTWMGEESHRYAQLAERFSEMVESDDASVVAVGEAGRDMYLRARDAASEDERKKRIRGEL